MEIMFQIFLISILIMMDSLMSLKRKEVAILVMKIVHLSMFMVTKLQDSSIPLVKVLVHNIILMDMKYHYPF